MRPLHPRIELLGTIFESWCSLIRQSFHISKVAVHHPA